MTIVGYTFTIEPISKDYVDSLDDNIIYNSFQTDEKSANLHTTKGSKSSLKDKNAIDFFSLIEDHIIYEGVDGYATVLLDFEDDDEINSGEVYFVFHGPDVDGTHYFNVIKDNKFIAELSLTFSGKDLKSGDEVVFNLRLDADVSEATDFDSLKTYGIVLLEESHTFTVPELPNHFLSSTDELSTVITDNNGHLKTVSEYIKYLIITAIEKKYDQTVNSDDIQLYLGTIKPSAVNDYKGKCYVLSLVKIGNTQDDSAYKYIMIGFMDIYVDSKNNLKFDNVPITSDVIYGDNLTIESILDNYSDYDPYFGLKRNLIKDYTFEQID